MRQLLVLMLLLSINCYSLEIRSSIAQIFPLQEKIPSKVGLVVSLRGNVLITRNGRTYPLKIKDSLYTGDKLETAPRAFVQIDFIDHSKISLHGSSDFKIDAYQFPGQEQVEYVGSISNGFLSFMAGQIGKIAPQNYKIETSTASVGIRGSSGEILTSDGTLAKRPKKLEVMKKGGLGLTIAAKIPQGILNIEGPISKDVLTVINSGEGFFLDQNQKLQKKQFITTPLEKYQKEEILREQNSLQKDSSKNDDLKKAPKEPLEVTNSAENNRFFTQATETFYEQFEESFLSFDLAIPSIDNLLEELGSILENTEDLKDNVVAERVEDDRESYFYDEQQKVLNSNSIDYEGLLTGYGDNSSYQNLIYVGNKEQSLIFYNELFETLYEIDYENSSSLQSVSVNETSQALLVHDSKEEFFLLNLKHENAEELFYFGKTPTDESTEIVYDKGRAFKQRVANELPNSGRVIYENFHQESHVKSALEATFSNALLSNAGAAIDGEISYSEAISAVDFSTNELLGFMAHDSSHYPSLSLPPSSDSSSTDFHNWNAPSLILRASLRENGLVENVKLYLQNGITENTELYNTSLDKFSGQGQLFGSKGQGLGIQATHSNGYFVLGAHQNDHLEFVDSLSGSYRGYLQGIHLQGFSPSYLRGDLSLTAQFEEGAIAGSLSFDGKTALIDGLGFSTNMIFSEISHSALNNSASFITSFDTTQTAANTISDIIWGSWNASESRDKIYPGMHNFFSASIAGSMPKSASELVYYEGLLGATHIETTDSLITSGENLSSIGVSKFALNPQSQEIKGLHFFDSGKLLIFQGNSADQSSFEGNLSALSLELGDPVNSELFSNSTDSLGSLQGQFSNLGNLSFDYQRKSENANEVEVIYGAGLAFQEKQAAVEAMQFIGDMEGLNFASNGGIYLLEGGDLGVDMIFSFDALVNQGEHEMDVLIAASDNFQQNLSYLTKSNHDHNTFINKDAFIAHLESVHPITDDPNNISFGASFGPELANASKSYIIGLPGLEDHLYSSWGMWSTRGASSNDQLFGYFSMARTENQYLPDMSALASKENLYHYEGIAIASIFDAASPKGRMSGGFSSFDVNFYNGQVMGQVNLNTGQNIYFDGWNIASSTSFEGTSSLNGVRSPQSFSMSLAGPQAKEAVGSFAALDSQSAISGAFGAAYKSSHSLEKMQGYLMGVAVDGSGIELLDGNTLGLNIEAAKNRVTGLVEIEDINNGKSFSLRMSQEGNSFLNKDSFFSLLQTFPDPSLSQVSIGNEFTLDFISPDFSIVSALGGLEEYEYVSWGKWLIYGSQTQALGYFGAGNNNSVHLPNMSDIIAGNPGTINYTGLAIASIFQNNNIEGIEELGQSQFRVNFAQGSINGNIQLPSLSIELLNGSLSGAKFSGQTRLNGTIQSDGFYGSFYGPQAQEAAGAFHAKDSTYRVSGAFGAKKN